MRFDIVKRLANYHYLLALSAFVWVWLYNGEFWSKVDTYIAHNLCSANKTNQSNQAKIPITFSSTPTLGTPATTQTKSTKQALPTLDKAHQNQSSHSISSDLSLPPPPPSK